MTVAVDTNILLDILLPDPNFKNSSFAVWNFAGQYRSDYAE